MLLRMIAVRDTRVEAFMPCTPAPHTGMAVREFTDACRDGSTNFAKHPEDFELWYLADYDDQTGLFSVPKEGLQRLCRAVDCVVKEH